MAGKTTDHSNRAHALLSASGAARWLACPPSARLEERSTVKDTSSIYAEEGTLAHELADITLQREFKGMHGRTFNAEKKKIATAVKKLFDGDDKVFVEMEREVQKYVDYVKECFAEAKRGCPSAVIILEERVDYSHIVPGGFGTGDCIIVADGLMYIIDLKYGRGVEVHAKTNPQMMLYAVGALRAFDLMYEIERVRHCVAQVRLDNISEWECSVQYIEKWALTVAAPQAKLAHAGDGEMKAGDHCKFCKVKALCRTLADHNLELARHEFRDPQLMSLEELAPIYEQAGTLVEWVNAVGDHLFEQALKGNVVPNHKIVEGRSNRKWADEKKAAEILEESGFKTDDFMRSSLETITNVQRLVGKDIFDEKLGPCVVKPPGKPTLVHVTDKRPAIGLDTAKREFKVEE